MARHWPNGQPPNCVHPLGIATREHEKKLRLIYDARYINLWQKHVPFKYETLDDVINMMPAEDGWGTVSDYKQGYNQICCPELSSYLARKFFRGFVPPDVLNIEFLDELVQMLEEAGSLELISLHLLEEESSKEQLHASSEEVVVVDSSRRCHWGRAQAR